MNKYIYAGLFIFTLWGCNETNPSDENLANEEKKDGIITLTDTQLKTIGLNFDTVGLVNIPMVKQMNGFVDVPPEKKITLSAPIGGFVERLEVLNGMQVKRGQFILSLKDQSFIQLQEQYLTTYHQWKVDKANFERQEELAAEKINSVKTLQQAKATYDASTVMLAGMRARLNMMNVDISKLESGNITNTYNVYAPIDGYISSIMINKGKYVSNAEALVDIVDVSAVYANLNVFEKDISAISLKQHVQIQLSDAKTILPAKISFIGKNINEDRSLTVIANFQEKSSALIPGMYLTAFVELSNNQVLGVPNQAVVNYQMEKYVFVPTDHVNEFEAIKVDVKEFNHQYSSLVETDKIKRGQKVVLIGAYDLLSKWKNEEEED